MRGDADYCLCVSGRFVSLELKASCKSRVEKLQLHKLHSIERNGGLGIISYPENWDDVLQYITDLIDEPSKEKPWHLRLPTKR